MDQLPVYIGYDIREHAAYMVCASSVEHSIHDQYTFHPQGHPIPLNTRRLRRDGHFIRTWQVDSGGRFRDENDEKTFSTEFSHSRFLAPYLASEGRPQGERGWMLFCDCDFMFRRGVNRLLEHADPSKAVMVVKVPWVATDSNRKMDGQVQAPYRRKLWSSLILWNLDHPANDPLTTSTDAANYMPGSWLHGFDWLDDHLIGALPYDWNFIPGLSDVTQEDEGDVEHSPSAVHWSYGGPWMQGYYEQPYAEEWRRRFSSIVRHIDPSEPTGKFADLFPLL